MSVITLPEPVLKTASPCTPVNGPVIACDFLLPVAPALSVPRFPLVEHHLLLTRLWAGTSIPGGV